ncbi:MAG: PAS domain S-box protein, partial [Geminicoccaceae bacterium]|nr:PAS domain S-box protein [Geminicoccaceae bacterium]
MTSTLQDIFSTSLFAPVAACLGWWPELVLVYALSDLVIGSCLLGTAIAIYAIVQRHPEGSPGRLLDLVMVALGAVGVGHLIGVLTLWVPLHGLEAVARLLVMLLAGAAAALLWPRLPELLAWPLATRQRNQRLVAEIGQRLRAEDVLKDALLQLERRVADRTQELQDATLRLVERERALATKSQLMETTLNAIDNGICIFDPSGRLRAWNHAYERLTVLSQDSLQEGLALDNLLMRVARAGVLGPGRPEDLVRERLEAMRAADQPLHEEQVQPDGSVIRVARFRSENHHHVFTLTDVTVQRRLEDELRTAKERWELASTGTNDGLFDWQVESGGLYLSPAWCRIVGYEPDQLAPRLSTWRKMVWEQDWAETWKQIETTFNNGSDRLQAEYRLKHKDGHAVWVDARARIVRSPAGRPVRVVGTITDITERRQAAEALRASEERFRSLYNRTPAMMHSVDEDTRLLSVSDYWLERLGYRREEVIGRSIVDFMTPATRDEIPGRFQSLLDEGIVRDLPYQFVTASDQVIDVLLSAIAERHPSGGFRQSLAVLSDVTELRCLERQLRESQERFESAVSATQDGVWDWDLESDMI